MTSKKTAYIRITALFLVIIALAACLCSCSGCDGCSGGRMDPDDYAKVTNTITTAPEGKYQKSGFMVIEASDVKGI